MAWESPPSQNRCDKIFFTAGNAALLESRRQWRVAIRLWQEAARVLRKQAPFTPENIERHAGLVRRECAAGERITREKTLERIAKKHLRIPVLRVRGEDELNFYGVAVASVSDALQAAYDAGRESVQGQSFHRDNS